MSLSCSLLRFPILAPTATLLAALLAGCESTAIRDSWVDPDYQGAPLMRIVVLAVYNTSAERRTLEDIVSTKINATGSHGIPGYQYISQEGKAEEAHIDNAVKTAGADGLLMIHLKAVETRTQVAPQMMLAPGFYGFYGFYGGYGWYNTWYAAPNIYQYDVATVEISLFDVKTQGLLWTGTTETVNPRPVAEKAPEFADKIVNALKKRKLLPDTPSK